MPNLSSYPACVDSVLLCTPLLHYYMLYLLCGSSLVATEDAKNIVNDISPANIITVYLYTVASEI